MKSLKHLAFRSENSFGRKYYEDQLDDPVFFKKNNPFKIDYHKIINSKSFRRLADKTQVFPIASNPLVRNRLIHSLEVSSISEIMAEMLELNSSLSSAIGIGHDLGHFAFGHLGERTIEKLSGQKFRHELFGVILAERIERSGLGLNLSWETLKGITKHSRGSNGLSIDEGLPLEFGVVMLADKIAYLFSDINDCLRTGFLIEKKLPKYYLKLGKNQRQRIITCLKAIQQESLECGKIKFQETPEAILFEKMRKWMYENVYFILDDQTNKGKMEIALQKTWIKVVKFCEKKPELSPVFITAIMTDNEVFQVASEKKELDKYNLGFSEIIPYCKKHPYQENDILVELDKRKLIYQEKN
jgi:dGTPase